MTNYSRLQDEIEACRSPGFHVVEGREGPAWESLGSQCNALPSSYIAFVREFGRARLYRLRKDTYALGVVAPPAPATHKSGNLLQVGHWNDVNAYFKQSDLSGSWEAPVYEWGAGGLQRVAGSFKAWIDGRMRRARKLIGKQAWLETLTGPPPFTDQDREILNARRQFKWRVAGVSEEGDMLFEIANGSNRVLPYLSVGVRSRSGSLAGAVWIPVASIPPGSTSVITKGVYKRLVQPDQLEFFPMPDPEPQDKADYWEFRALEPSVLGELEKTFPKAPAKSRKKPSKKRPKPSEKKPKPG